MDKKELIAQYISNKLSTETQKEFDNLLLTDPKFAEEVKFEKNLKIVIENDEREFVKSQLQGFEAEEKATPSYRKWFIAASITVLICISAFWFLNNSIDTEKLYADNFEPYRNVVQPILRGETKKDLKTKAFTAYETKNYTEALKYFDDLLNANPDETIAFYKANVLLQLNNTEEAISIFKNNLKTPDSLDAKNNWYLALAYLKLNDIENAKNILNDLNRDSSFKNKTVKQLLKKIN